MKLYKTTSEKVGYAIFKRVLLVLIIQCYNIFNGRWKSIGKMEHFFSMGFVFPKIILVNLFIPNHKSKTAHNCHKLLYV